MFTELFFTTLVIVGFTVLRLGVPLLLLWLLGKAVRYAQAVLP